jgi:hypothetical protein
MRDLGKHFDGRSLLVMAITLVLFVAALFTKGFAHDLLLEAGVFLAPAKLILMAYKNSLVNDTVQQKLDDTVQYSGSRTIQWLRDANVAHCARPSVRGDCPAAGVSDQPGG